MVFLSFMWANLGNKCSHIICVHHFEKVLFSIAGILLKNTPSTTTPHILSPHCRLAGLALSSGPEVPPAAYLFLPFFFFFFFLVTNNGTLQNSTALEKRFQKVQWDQELGEASACWIPSRILKPHPMGFEDSWNPIFSALCMSHLSFFTYLLLNTHPDIWHSSSLRMFYTDMLFLNAQSFSNNVFYLLSYTQIHMILRLLKVQNFI